MKAAILRAFGKTGCKNNLKTKGKAGEVTCENLEFCYLQTLVSFSVNITGLEGLWLPGELNGACVETLRPFAVETCPWSFESDGSWPR